MPENTSRKLRYVGPHRSVAVPALGEGVTVDRNHQIVVEDAAIAASLLEQSDNWQSVPATKDTTDGKKDEG